MHSGTGAGFFVSGDANATNVTRGYLEQRLWKLARAGEITRSNSMAALLPSITMEKMEIIGRGDRGIGIKIRGFCIGHCWLQGFRHDDAIFQYLHKYIAIADSGDASLLWAWWRILPRNIQSIWPILSG